MTLANTGLHASDYAVLVVYLLLMLAIGLYFGRGEHNTESYLLGGRRIAWWVAGISYMVSVVSTLSVVAIPGEAYKDGVTFALATFLSPIAAIATFFIFVRFYFKMKVFTPFTYLERRFDGRVRAVTAGLFCLTRLLYISLVLYSSSKVFEYTVGWPATPTIILVGVVGIAYTALGGIRAVVWTDLAQFFILVGGLAVIGVIVILAVPGGLGGMFDYAIANDHFVSKPDKEFFSFNPYVRWTFWIVLLGPIIEALFFHCSDQISLQRLLSTSGYSQAKRAMYTMVAVSSLMMFTLWFVGLAIWVFYQHQPPDMRPERPDEALLMFITSELPRPLPGLMVAALLAASMSTLDSGINSLATVLTKDYYQRLFRKDATEYEQVSFSRWMTVATGVFAIGVALGITQISNSFEDTVLETSFLWLALNSILPPAFLLAVFSRRARARHVLIALGLGAATVVGLVSWYLIDQSSGRDPIAPFHIQLAGFVVTLVSGIVLSRFTPRRRRDELQDLTLWTLEKQHPTS